ncbi:MAG: hypothetical protein HZC28_08315 [Spirochaetes bacterium]|nr:hypothetical protein [Spirochaetota bacterium]
MKRIIFYITALTLCSALVSGETNTPVTNTGIDTWITAEAAAAVEMRHIWRGIEIYGNSEPALMGYLAAGIKPINLYASATGSWALADRDDPYYTSLYDQIAWRLFTDWTFFERMLNVALGATLYQNTAWAPSHYGAMTFEIFWRVGCPAVFTHPSLEVYHDLTPNQSGFYWVIDLRETFVIFSLPVDIVFDYGHANGFQKQGSYRFLQYIFKDPLYAMQDILPTDLSLSAAVPFTPHPSMRITPYVKITLTTDKFLTRDPLSFTGGCSVHYLIGATNTTMNRMH